MAAITSPTVLRARMSVSHVCGAPAAGLDVRSSDAAPSACAAPPSQVSQDQMACVSAAAAISAAAAVQVAAEDPFVRDLRPRPAAPSTPRAAVP
jgi:hypothetical protein